MCFVMILYIIFNTNDFSFLLKTLQTVVHNFCILALIVNLVALSLHHDTTFKSPKNKTFMAIMNPKCAITKAPDNPKDNFSFPTIIEEFFKTG